MEFVKKAFIITLLVIISSSSSAVTSANNNDEKIGGIFVWPTRVQIFNNLNDEVQLTVHCRSGDDDLGAHVLASNQEYEFKFRINFTGTTLYSCSLTWIGGTGSYQLFKASRDSDRCASKCVWRAHNDGIYGFKEGRNQTKADIIYKWT
ncbi:S-protein homolog 24-like [Cannabis sativa]|uniref:S-protein homolog n=2 Tax=Cannabis sativa TaxID=3483 RepID=A0A7J6FQG0_CANSA|nr:S-protein homolog 24-like [Cannabis sativa]KAF4372882.1 hypothetical protein F8388_004092 [Cannabis sativa]KAF4379531.1 hypothetical protein G4B88_028773 [Cannabis sativa]